MTEQELHALAQDAFRHGLLTPEEAQMLAGGYIGLRAERDALIQEVTTQMDGSAGAGVLQAVLDAITGTLDPHTQMADHPNVKFAQMERLKLEVEREALKAQLTTALGPPVPACPHCAFHEPEWFPEAGCWLCNHCMRHLDQITHYRQVLTPAAAEATA